MPLKLTFATTKTFRDELISKNLKPYSVPGAYTPPVGDRVYDTVLSTYSVIDSPDDFIAKDPFADKLYPLNAYGPEGGFPKFVDAGGLAGTKTNLGPYDYSDNKLPFLSEPIQRTIPTQNKYAPENTIQLVSINNIQSTPTFKQYTDPLSFVPSSYSPYQILLQDNPTGDNGSLSQDSFIAQLGSKILKRELRERISREIVEKTVGRVNLPNALNDPIQGVRLLQGRIPIVERDWVITRADNVLIRSADFVSRLGGFYFPGSQIPGDYFEEPQNNLNLFGQIARAFNGGKDPRTTTDSEGNQRATGIGKLLGRFITTTPSPSQLFLNNTGGGQKSQLYFNLSFNRYAPDYEKSIVGEVIDTARRAFNSILDNPTKGGYYIGNRQLNPSRLNSPSDSLPNDPFARQIIAPVYGPDKAGKQFEGDNQDFRFGLNGKSFVDSGGDISGGFVWVSPKNDSPLIKGVQKSTTYDFKDSSILDITQRFINSADDLNGPQKFSHVGNAMNQLSTIFNDGYKQITKGSQVGSFTNPAKGVHVNQNVYCRIFTKAEPYRTYADLQKTDGIVTEGRRFSYSVLDKTYNLNIAPIKGVESTNIVNGRVKKYMFSLENLAWRTSNREGLRYQDLPECERGPNGGRIMWFPPYDLKFTESTRPNFQGTSFLGRPEPIYTYKDTTRDGTLSWKIIVDHPSVINLVVNKELKSETNVERINKIVDSFFAGCLKYDLYELAKRWNTIPSDQLFKFQQIITSPNVKPEDVELIKNEIPKTEPDYVDEGTPLTIPEFSDYTELGYYFDDNIPSSSSASYDDTYKEYINNKDNYKTYDLNSGKPTLQFFDAVVEYNFKEVNESLIKDIKKYFNDYPKNDDGTSDAKIEIDFLGQTSAIASSGYNEKLSKRRIESIKNYYKKDPELLKLINEKKLILREGTAQGEKVISRPKSKGNQSTGSFNCTDEDKNVFTDEKGNKYDPKWSVNAMACRRVFVQAIKPEGIPPIKQPPKRVVTAPKDEEKIIPPQVKPIEPVVPFINIDKKIRDGISKKIIRYLLSECDYFELVKETNPMFIDSLKEKLKFFDPAFHSMTPEGLNSRLTFLQQCTRPGDTIPSVGADGKLKYNNAINTNFGAPPVLVLRVGDFFHTKIIPNSLQISYEGLDINPEGIGVQPMIAIVSLNFHIIGGMGLKEPVEKLQNALSFNYYANTEIYDERADFTDDSFKTIDKEVVDAILEQEGLETVANNKQALSNDGGTTIGVIESKSETSSGTTGTITYQKIMNELFTQSQSYIDLVSNAIRQIISENNSRVYQLYVSKRNYSKGKNNQFESSAVDVDFYGKSDDFEKRIQDVKRELNKEISDASSFESKVPIIDGLYFSEFNESKVISRVKKRMKSEIDNHSSEIINKLSLITQDLTTIEQNLVKTFAKLDVVCSKIDGFIKPTQEIITYNLSATTDVSGSSPSGSNTYDELVKDYSDVSKTLDSFYEDLKNNALVDITFENKSFNVTFSDAWFRFYLLMSDIILDDTKKQSFIDNLTKDISNEVGKSNVSLQKIMTGIVEDLARDYKRLQEEFDQKLIKTIDEKIIVDYKDSFDDSLKSKIRRFEFNSKPDGTKEQKNRIKNLYRDGNSNNDKATYNGKNKLN